jgi:hypothetical protein
MTGRPSEYSQTVAEAITERIADGESLRSICSDEAMPAKSTVFKWLSQNKDFADQYARAREEQAETLASEIVAIADEECTTIRADKHGAKPDGDAGEVEVVFDSTAVARNRLRVDARKWVAAKLKPKVYGEKVEHSGAVGILTHEEFLETLK